MARYMDEKSALLDENSALLAWQFYLEANIYHPWHAQYLAIDVSRENHKYHYIR